MLRRRARGKLDSFESWSLRATRGGPPHHKIVAWHVSGWRGVNPIVIGLQTIQSRQADVTNEPSVLTVGTFKPDRGTILSLPKQK